MDKFYVFNTNTQRYVKDDYSSAFRGRDVPLGFSSSFAAEKFIASKPWADPGTYTVHSSIDETFIQDIE